MFINSLICQWSLIVMLIFSRLIFSPFLSWSSIISEKYKRISKLLSLLQKQELYSFCELSYKSVYILPFLTERNSSSSPKCSTNLTWVPPLYFCRAETFVDIAYDWSFRMLKFESCDMNVLTPGIIIVIVS